MKVREHPKVIGWPPELTNNYPAIERPSSEELAVLREVHSVNSEFVPITAEYRRSLFSGNVHAKEEAFAQKLAATFSQHIGSTVKVLGDLEINY